MILYDEKDSIFNGLSADDVTGFINEQKMLMEEKTLNNGLMERARSNATKVLKTLLSGFVDAYETDTEYPMELNFIIQE